jgi:YesN/AraC family two-component response regulator
MIDQLMAELRGVVIKINLQMPKNDIEKIEQMIEQIKRADVDANMFIACSNYCIAATEYIEQKKASIKDDLIKEVRAYIKDHYADYDMGLARIAQEFNISESLLSQMFKKNVGENLSLYIEKMRINKAVELLQMTNETIDSIATAVGYSYTQVFRRGFKRQTGSTPSVYRKNGKS